MKRIEEKFLQHVKDPVQYIALSEYSTCYDDNLWSTYSVIVSFGDVLFELIGKQTGEDMFGYSYKEITDYDKMEYPYLVKTSVEEPIRLVGLDAGTEDRLVMRFMIGERPILITSDGDGLTIGISHCGPNDEWLEFENNRLVNGNQ